MRPLLFWHGDTDNIPAPHYSQKGSDKVLAIVGAKSDAQAPPTEENAGKVTATENESTPSLSWVLLFTA